MCTALTGCAQRSRSQQHPTTVLETRWTARPSRHLRDRCGTDEGGRFGRHPAKRGRNPSRLSVRYDPIDLAQEPLASGVHFHIGTRTFVRDGPPSCPPGSTRKELEQRRRRRFGFRPEQVARMIVFALVPRYRQIRTCLEHRWPQAIVVTGRRSGLSAERPPRLAIRA